MGGGSTHALFFKIVSGSFPSSCRETPQLSCLSKLLGSFQLKPTAEPLITPDSCDYRTAGSSPAPTLPTKNTTRCLYTGRRMNLVSQTSRLFVTDSLGQSL